DVTKHHWACIVRHDGDPSWVQIPGSGPDGAWTKDDEGRPGEVREALAGHQPAWSASAEALARLRLGAPRPPLKGVKRLIVLPSRALAGVPVEALVAALSKGSTRPVVSYAPSGSMFARLSAPRSQPPGPARLLALGDPAFPRPAPSGPAPTPPDHGIALLAVARNSTADLFGLSARDVLLEYNRNALKAPSALAVVPPR